MSANLLKAKTVDAIRSPGLHSDGGGLFLQVAPSGSRSWIYRYKVAGKHRSMGLGGYPVVSLADARKQAVDARVMRLKGVDPLEAKRARGPTSRQGDVMTFKDCTDAYLAAFGPTLKNDKHRAQWKSTLYAHAIPAFGSTPVADVSRQQILDMLKGIWWKTPETASRIRGRIETVLGYAIAEGYRTTPNAAEWKGLKGALPLKTKIKAVKHYGFMPYADVTPFIAELRAVGGLPALAFELLILTCVRTKELLFARHEEFDLDGALWTIPAGRMKVKSQAHRVPLAPRAIEIVKRAMEHRRGDDPLLFPGRAKGKPFSDMVFLMMLRRMGHGAFTGHGFRSSFKTWASEQTAYPDMISEMALAHLVGNEVSRSYQRSDLLEKRRALMLDWAAFIEQNAP